MNFMKKIIGLFLLVLLVVGGYFGYSYWNDTYRGVVAYAVVPNEVPEKKQMRDQDGKVQSGLYSYDYTLTFIKENGESQTMEVSITDSNPVPLVSNSYVKAKISKKRVIEGPNQVNKSDIPEKVVNKLKNK
ncbi:YxeA family protein [Erwinia sp. CPCC 100877]|nr:YxeA family protein [Erwinia sp. CPCC 100877]